MKYFLDTEFLEGTQKKFIGRTKPTIDLISIGIVAEDGREYYAISSEFNLKEAWNRYQTRTGQGDRNNIESREYWIRENVLFPIFKEYYREVHGAHMPPFTYGAMKTIIDETGLTREEIAHQVLCFVHKHIIKKYDDHLAFADEIVESAYTLHKEEPHEFYGYYADYDWVVFCWIFGNMMKLPSGFPMYCNDLKQMLDQKAAAKNWYYGRDIWSNTRKEGDTELQEKDRPATLSEKIEKVKRHVDYPKQVNEHNALADARWNRQLWNFIDYCFE